MLNLFLEGERGRYNEGSSRGTSKAFGTGHDAGSSSVGREREAECALLGEAVGGDSDGTVQIDKTKTTADLGGDLVEGGLDFRVEKLGVIEHTGVPQREVYTGSGESGGGGHFDLIGGEAGGRGVAAGLEHGSADPLSNY